MAAGILPAPGTEYGPCVAPCRHRDCAATRRTALKVCRHCGAPVGYERRFYEEPGYVDADRRATHADCEERAIEAERAG